MHDALRAMCIEKEDKYVQVEMVGPGSYVHASGGRQHEEYSNYFNKPRFEGDVKEYMIDLLAKNICYVRIKPRVLLLFLFLPNKENIGLRIPLN